MQKIHVKRYESPTVGFAGSIEPEDRSWVLFIAKDGAPSLFRLAGTTEIDGKTEDAYLPAGDPLFAKDGEAA